MKYQWKKGMSLSFFQNEKRESIGADPEILREVGEHGFDCVELSFSHDEYFYKYRFTEEENAEKLASYCKESGLEIWSIQLCFNIVLGGYFAYAVNFQLVISVVLRNYAANFHKLVYIIFAVSGGVVPPKLCVYFASRVRQGHIKVCIAF